MTKIGKGLQKYLIKVCYSLNSLKKSLKEDKLTKNTFK